MVHYPGSLCRALIWFPMSHTYLIPYAVHYSGSLCCALIWFLMSCTNLVPYFAHQSGSLCRALFWFPMSCTILVPYISHLSGSLCRALIWSICRTLFSLCSGFYQMCLGNQNRLGAVRVFLNFGVVYGGQEVTEVNGVNSSLLNIQVDILLVELQY